MVNARREVGRAHRADVDWLHSMSTRSTTTRSHDRRALNGVNETFHEAYGAAAEAANDEPILIVLADDLVLCVGKERVIVPFSPPFHAANDRTAPIALGPVGPPTNCVHSSRSVCAPPTIR